MAFVCLIFGRVCRESEVKLNKDSMQTALFSCLRSRSDRDNSIDIKMIIVCDELLVGVKYWLKQAFKDNVNITWAKRFLSKISSQARCENKLNWVHTVYMETISEDVYERLAWSH